MNDKEFIEFLCYRIVNLEEGDDISSYYSDIADELTKRDIDIPGITSDL